jgi:hypothetical protein
MSAFDDNPFADPSVQAATANNGGPTANLENYDPFGKQQTTTTAGPGPAVGPAVMSPTAEAPPPTYSQTAQQTATTADFQRRQEELERKAAELARREEELKNSTYNARTNNWPPLPSFLPFQPCFYQDINVDIPVEFQEMVKRLYYLWLFHALLMVFNLMAGTCLLFSGNDATGSTFGLSLVYAVFFIPLSYLCWFRPAYKAFRSDSSFNFMVFFFIFFCQFCFSLIMALGIAGSGGSGLITAIVTFQNKEATGGDYFVGVVVLIVALGFCLVALADFFMLTKIHGLYRATGASLSKAQQEFTSTVLSNEGVRNAAAQAAAAGVRNTFSGQQGQQQQQQQTGSRY